MALVLSWADGDPVVRFAAGELATYLERMLGRPLERTPVAEPAGTWLRVAGPGPQAPIAPPADAEAMVQPAGDGVVLTASNPRALLTVTYAFLEALGCRWSPGGTDAELVPRLPPGAPLPALVLRPAFARRAYAADLATWHYTVPDRLAQRLPGDRAFIDWLAKSGGTGLLFIRHANDTQWVIPELLPVLRQRGLAIEIGGHALVALLPRETFAVHPEYFPLTAGGTRSDLGNCCPSNGDALALIAARARQAAASLPDAGAFHLWGLDLYGGGWCRCPTCATLTPGEQALLVCNRVAETMPGALYHLAYHDTLPPPVRVRPHPGVRVEFAPRERCYGHALDDPACATNGRYREALLGHLECFDGRVDVFEYYADAILFGGCAVPLTAVIAQDLAFYRRAGVRGVSCLTFGQYSLWAYGANLAAFARASYDPSAPAQAMAYHCERTHGARAADAERYLTALERVMRTVVTYGDLLLPPRRTADAGRVHAALAAALGDADDLRDLLRRAGGTPADERLLDYTFAALDAVCVLARGQASGGAVEEATAHASATLAAARAHLAAVDLAIAGTWGAYDLELTHHFYIAAWDA